MSYDNTLYKSILHYIKALSLIGKLQRGSTLVVNRFWGNRLRLGSRLNVIRVSRRSVVIVLGLWSTVWSTVATEAGCYSKACCIFELSSSVAIEGKLKADIIRNVRMIFAKDLIITDTLLRNCYNTNSSSYQRDIDCQRYWNCHEV